MNRNIRSIPAFLAVFGLLSAAGAASMPTVFKISAPRQALTVSPQEAQKLSDVASARTFGKWPYGGKNRAQRARLRGAFAHFA